MLDKIAATALTAAAIIMLVGAIMGDVDSAAVFAFFYAPGAVVAWMIVFNRKRRKTPNAEAQPLP